LAHGLSNNKWCNNPIRILLLLFVRWCSCGTKSVYGPDSVSSLYMQRRRWAISFELVYIGKRLLRNAQRYSLCLHTSILAMHAVLDLCTDRTPYPLSTREDGSGVPVN